MVSLTRFLPLPFQPNLSRSNLTSFCPEVQQCVEQVSKNRHWQGRACCVNAVMRRCADGCQISSSSKMLTEHCRKSDEFALYSCIETLERKSNCCSFAKTYGCMQVCQQMMFNKTINVNSLEDELHANCRDNNEDVVNCVYDNVNVLSAHQQEKFKGCCGFAHDKTCLDGCRSILNGGELTDNKVELLEQKCGTVNLKVEIWKCFLANESKNSNTNMQVGDLARLSCCIEKAHSTRCRKICISVFTYADMNSLDVFYKECLGNYTEISLSQCIEEIESPVELGCDGLSFCSNFNHHPRELFRSCNRFSDTAAKNEYDQWVKKSSLMLFGQEILINHSDSCLSLLHTFACSLHLKPSTRSHHYSQICHEDCAEIISTCNHNIEIKICSNLPQNVSCIALRDFSNASESDDVEIKMPCKEHQCNATTEICEVDRVNNKYFCSKGACQVRPDL
jgi:reversion-inducing cysteine-rich kazal motif protein